MKDRKDWGPADEWANAQMTAVYIVVAAIIILFVLYWLGVII